MKRTPCAVGLAALYLTWAAPAPGAILCKKKSGIVVVRDTCAAVRLWDNDEGDRHDADGVFTE